MRIEELIGRNVKEAREDAGLTQRKLGERVGEVLGRAWLPQAVSQAEKGGRDWAAQDLVAVAQALRRPIAAFLKVPTGADPMEMIDLPGDPILPLAWVSGEATREWTPDTVNEDLQRLAAEFGRVTKELKRLTAPPDPELHDMLQKFKERESGAQQPEGEQS